MSALSAVLREATDGMLLFWCPGCDGAHGIRVNRGGPSDGPRWAWNGDVDKPTFTPSILTRGYEMSAESRARIERGERIAVGERWPGRDTVCHSFVTDGRIQFLSDCTHHLVGQTVDIPPFDAYLTTPDERPIS